MVTPVDVAVSNPYSPAAGQSRTALQTPASNTGSGGEFRLFGEDGFTFFDFLDVINPLQHIPLISTLYRSITGDAIDPGVRIIGGTLFGGPIGAGISVANVVVDANTGKDIGEHVVALLNDEGDVPVPANTNSGIALADITRTTIASLTQPPPGINNEAVRLNAFATTAGNPGAARQTGPQLAARFAPPAAQAPPALDTARPAPDLGLLGDIRPLPARAPAVGSDAKALGSDANPVNSLAALRHPSFDRSAARAATIPAIDENTGFQTAALDAAVRDARPLPGGSDKTAARRLLESTPAEAARTSAPEIAEAGVADIRHPSFQVALAEAPARTERNPQAASANDGWVFNAMTRALEKYSAGAKLRESAAGGISVAR